MQTETAHGRSGSDDGAGRGALRVDLLGGLSVWLGGQEVPEAAIEGRKARSLLKLLALEAGHQLHRERVIDLVWPDLDAAAGAAQLYKAVYHIRRAFAAAAPEGAPEQMLAIRGEVLTLGGTTGVQTDVAAFNVLAEKAVRSGDLAAYERAVASYGGDLLPGDPYEDWAMSARDVLRERFLDLLVGLGERLLAMERLAEATDAFRRALAHDPTREAAHRGLMRTFALQGQRARALRQFRLCRDALARELEVEPTPETAALYEAMRRPEDVTVPPVAHGAAPTPAAPLPAAPLVGRRRELQVITTLLEAATRGRGAVLLVEGEAGIGKTRLAQELLRRARQRGYVALAGGAYEHEGRLPYGPFVEAMRAALRASPELESHVPAALGPAIPELRLAAERGPLADGADGVAA
ncbi:MAG: BREX system ATP-binding domain-containing protein, partial [Chloroflexota bacterium]